VSEEKDEFEFAAEMEGGDAEDFAPLSEDDTDSSLASDASESLSDSLMNESEEPADEIVEEVEAAWEFSDEWMDEFSQYADLNLPIEGDDPCGNQHKDDADELVTEFLTRRQAWSELDSNENPEDLSKFLAKCREVYQGKCKSLELPAICAWLEARNRGIVGLNDVLAWILSSQLVYGRQLCPRDLADYSSWVAPLFRSKRGQDTTELVRQIYKVPITQLKGGKFRDLWELLDSVKTKQAFAPSVVTKSGKPAKNSVPKIFQLWPEALKNNVWGTDFDFYQCRYDELQKCIQLCERINQTCCELYEEEVETRFPIVDRLLIDLLKEMETCVAQLVEIVHPHQTLTSSLIEPAIDEQEVNEDSTDDGSGEILSGADDTENSFGSDGADDNDMSEGGVDVWSVQVNNREDALTLLGKVAEYFKENERHSPIGYRLQEAINWSDMDLPELLMKIVGEGTDNFTRLSERLSLDAFDVEPQPDNDNNQQSGQAGADDEDEDEENNK
jgi:hypothetical protein